MTIVAELLDGLVVYHVARGDRFACGARRTGRALAKALPAAIVSHDLRCLRIGCSNDYAKADREERLAKPASPPSDPGSGE